MSRAHPTDRNLAALVDDRLSDGTADVVRRHISGCVQCQLRVGAAEGRVTFGADAGGVPDAVEIHPIPGSSVDAPRLGDVWRLAWSSTSSLAVIWNVDVDRLSVMPVVESADADEWTALVDRERTGGLGALAVAVALEITVPWSVLDTRLAGLGDPDGVASVRSAFRSGTPTAARRGEAIRSALDDRLVGLEQVAETFNHLANAE